MLDALTARLHIGLAPSCVAVVRTREWPRRMITEERTHAWASGSRPSSVEAGQALGSLLSRLPCRGLSAQVVLSDDLVRHWMVIPPVNARSVQDCRLAAQARFLALYGEGTEAWRWQADWRVDRPYLASALPAEWWVMLQQVCAAHGLHLQSIAPEMVSVWNRWRRHLRPGDWLASACGRRVTLGVIDTGGLIKIGRVALSDVAAAEADPAHPELQRAVAREALRWMLDRPQRLLWWGPVMESARQGSDSAEPSHPADPHRTCVALAAHRAAVSVILGAGAAVRPGLRLATSVW